MNGVASKQLRSFGLLVGSIFGLIGLWPTLLHGEGARMWALILAGLLMILSVALPTSLRPIYKVWMRLGTVLGWVNTRIILSIGFYCVFTPMGIVMRIFGKDPLRRRFDPDLTTYRIVRTPRPGSHIQKQF